MPTTATPLGYPHAGAGTVEILLEKEDGADFAVLFSPDPNNIELRESGQAMQFYYYPKNPRLAKHPDGKFKFSMQWFTSEGDETTVIGAEGLEEEAGAFTTLTSTIDIPETLLKKAIDKLKDKLHSEYADKRQSKLEGLLSFIKGVDKDFDKTNVRPIQLVENYISMHEVGAKSEENPFGGANPWAFNVQGEGAGTTFGLGENAFSILMGRNSASAVRKALENGTNNLTVVNRIKYKAYLPTTEIKVTINARKSHEYISSKFSAGVSWLKVKWEEEYNNIVTDGGIITEIITDNQFSDPERKKMEDALMTKARDFAFQLLQKEILDPKEKEAKEATDTEKLLEVVNQGFSLAYSLKTVQEIRELNFTDKIKFSAIEVMDSTISANLTPLTTKSGEEAKEDLKKYITDVKLDEDFSKIHVIVSLNGTLIKIDKDGEIMSDSAVNEVSIEVGYPDSKGNMKWKGSGRKIAPTGTPYVKTSSRAGKEIDAIFPASWNDKAMEKHSFVFDFVKNTTPSKVIVRQSIMFEKDKRVNVEDQYSQFEFDGTKVQIKFPKLKMINYSLSPVELLECDTLEVLLKVDKMPTKKFKFNADNYSDIIPYRVWYEMDYEIKPSSYQIAYTCKGKIGRKRKTVKLKSAWIPIEYTEGDVLFEIPEGNATQQKDIDAIRNALSQ